MNCSDIIKSLRVQKFYTQQYVADLLKKKKKTYSDYELGYTRIPIESLIILAKFYDVDMNYITGASDICNTYPKK